MKDTDLFKEAARQDRKERLDAFKTWARTKGFWIFVLAIVIMVVAGVYGNDPDSPPPCSIGDRYCEPQTQVIHTDKAAAPDGLTAAEREAWYANDQVPCKIGWHRVDTPGRPSTCEPR